MPALTKVTNMVETENNSETVTMERTGCLWLWHGGPRVVKARETWVVKYRRPGAVADVRDAAIDYGFDLPKGTPPECVFPLEGDE